MYIAKRKSGIKYSPKIRLRGFVKVTKNATFYSNKALSIYTLKVKFVTPFEFQKVEIQAALELGVCKFSENAKKFFNW